MGSEFRGPSFVSNFVVYNGELDAHHKIVMTQLQERSSITWNMTIPPILRLLFVTRV